jgi:hypothetical protein
MGIPNPPQSLQVTDRSKRSLGRRKIRMAQNNLADPHSSHGHEFEKQAIAWIHRSENDFPVAIIPLKPGHDKLPGSNGRFFRIFL